MCVCVYVKQKHTCSWFCPPDIKPKMNLSLRSDPPSHVLVNCQSSNSVDDMDEEEDSDTSSPPLPYVQGPTPDGCCTVDGKNSCHNLLTTLMLFQTHMTFFINLIF